MVAKREHDGPVRVVQDVGARRPLHCTAVAKAILPWLPAPELAGLLARLRSAGYATDDEEHIEGIRCIAMPVFGHTGQVLGSICTLGPRSRMTYQRLRDLRVPLGELARRVSERLGFDP